MRDYYALTGSPLGRLMRENTAPNRHHITWLECHSQVEGRDLHGDGRVVSESSQYSPAVGRVLAIRMQLVNSVK